jgi:hypothetical protein
MSSYDAISSGRVIVNGDDLPGSVFDTSIVTHRTVLDKVMLVNHTGTAWYVNLLIRKLGQTTNNTEFLVLVKKMLSPHQTYILDDELRGEVMDFPARMVGDVFDAVGTSFQTGNVSIFVTGTQVRN